jgi:hypothetical protein
MKRRNRWNNGREGVIIKPIIGAGNFHWKVMA